METWNGYHCEQIIFENHKGILVFPEKKEERKRLLVKTEYWNAFPETEIYLLKNGFYLCYLENDNRWGTNEDLDRKARFIRFLQANYHLSAQCVPIGMSCGGLIAVKLAARYPELISCLYLDAPVINYMSCPCGFGIAQKLNGNPDEILKALKLENISELLGYREMPLDKIPDLVFNKIPVILVAGDKDQTVPFCENGLLLQQAYKDAGVDIDVYIKPGCDHHPHGLENPEPILRFLLKYAG